MTRAMRAEVYTGAPWLIEGECGYSEHPAQVFREEDVTKCRRAAVYEMLSAMNGRRAVACAEHTAWMRANRGDWVAAVMSL